VGGNEEADDQATEEMVGMTEFIRLNEPCLKRVLRVSIFPSEKMRLRKVKGVPSRPMSMAG